MSIDLTDRITAALVSGDFVRAEGLVTQFCSRVNTKDSVELGAALESLQTALNMAKSRRTDLAREFEQLDSLRRFSDSADPTSSSGVDVIG